MQTILSKTKGLLMALCLQFSFMALAQAQCSVIMVMQNNPSAPNTWYFYAIDSMNCVSNNATYLWSFGDGDSAVGTQAVHTYPVTTIGTYTVCLTIQDQGTTWTQCRVLTVNGINTCNLTLAGNPVPNSFNWYFGIIDSTQCLSPNATFSWNFGDNSPAGTGQEVAHTFPGPGFYTVCVNINNNGVLSTECMYANIDSIQGGCDPFLSGSPSALNPSEVTFVVENFENCTTPATNFLWTFGDGTSGTGQAATHTYAQPGTYQVCLVITGNGPVVDRCISYTVNSITPFVTLGGRVGIGANQCYTGLVSVELIGINNNEYQAITTNGGADSCYYFFSAPANKTYVIRATPLNSASNGQYLPTYYGDQIFWSEATVILPAVNQPIFNLDITLQTSLWSTIGSGDGTINGSISGDGTPVTTSFGGGTITTTFDAQQAHAIILNANNQPIGFAYVDANGNFSFPNMPEGQYFLRIESPKVNSATYPIAISNASPTVNVAVNATGTGIDVVTSTRKTIGAVNLQVVPNPATNVISVVGTKGLVSIINAQGKTVMEVNDANQIQIGTLAPGMYFIRATTTANEVINTRFFKK